MVVTLRASNCQTQPDRAESAGSVDSLLEEELLGVYAAFPVAESVAMESGRHSLLDGGVGQQVTGDLFDREPVEAHAAVERVNHPPTVAPGVRPRVVLRVSVRVRIADLVEPVNGLLLAEVFGREKPVDNPIVRIVATVFQESALLFDCGHQAGQIERHTREERSPVSLRCRFEPFTTQPLAHEVVDRIHAGWHLWTLDRLEGPMVGSGSRNIGLGLIARRLGPDCPLIDPCSQQADF